MRTKRSSACLSAFRRTPLVAALAYAFIAPAAMAQVPHDPAQLIVTNTNTDGSAGSLDYAINYANLYCDTVTSPKITFAIPGGGPFVISPSSTLQTFYCESSVTYSPTIDGSTQSGYTPNTAPGGFDSQLMIVVDGSINYGGGCGLSHNNNGYGGTLTLKGLDIRNWNYAYGSQYGVCGGKLNMVGNRITNNYYGVEGSDGSTFGGPNAADRNVVAGSPNGIGIRFDGTTSIVNNFVGTTDGTTASPNSTGIGWTCCTQPAGTISFNVIVSNYSGIDLNYDAAMTIQGNYIGTDSSGTSVLALGQYGISMYYSYGANIRDNVIAGQTTGIDNYSGSNVYIYNNKIGTDVSGNTALGNDSGIYEAYTYGTRIEGNVVSGNSETAVYLYTATDPVVVGNLIGTNSGGNAAMPNWVGVYVGGGGPTNNTITNNTISGNYVGVYLADLSSSAVVGNRIGTGAGGAGSIPNDYGIWAECGSGLTFDGNQVANNLYAGMQLWAIQGSLFNGNSIVNNGGHGIEATYASCGFVGDFQSRAPKAAKATRMLVFGMNESDNNQFVGNVVAQNSGKGLFIQGGSGNQIFQNSFSTNLIDGIRIDAHYDAYGAVLGPAVGNSIVETLSFGNGGKNINLAFDGAPLPNDPGDADTNKPNNWQNRPVIAAVTRDTLANTTTFDFALDSKAGDYRIDFFANPSPGSPAGQTYVGNTSISLAADGNTAGSFSVNSVAYDHISAVATRAGPEIPSVMDSSEFADVVSANTLPVPGVSVLPNPLNFGDVVVGRSSDPSSVGVMSTGTGPYIISQLRDGSCTGPAICSTGSFICSTSCVEGTPYATGASCTITASFAPTTLGSQTKTLALCDNVVGSPRTITFNGNGVATPDVDIAIAPLSWNFGQVPVGLQSAPKTFVVTNAGSTQVYLGPVRADGDFAILGSNCGATLAGGASCSADVAFVPTGPGTVLGAVEITGSNTPSTPAALRSKVTTPTTRSVSAQLAGSGLQFGDLRLPASMSFGTLVLHSAPAQQQLQLTNTGNGQLALGTMSVTGAFTLANGCGSSLAVGASCTLTLSFNPANLGTFNGTLTVLSDAPGGSRAIALTAQVIADSRPVVRVNTNSVGFGERTIGSQSPPQRLIVTNEGAQTANLLGFSFSQPENENKKEFSLGATSCGVTLAPASSCFADVVFKPLGFGSRNGTFIVPSNSADSPQVVTLGGTGCRPPSAANNRSGRDPCK